MPRPGGRGPAPADRRRHAVHLLRRGDRADRPASRTSASGRPMRWDASQPAAGFSDAEPWETVGRRPGRARTSPPRRPTRTRSSPRIGTRDPPARRRIRRSRPGRGPGRAAEAVGRRVPAARSRARSLLVVANVGDAPVDAPALSLEAGPLCGSLAARVVHGEGEAVRARRRARPAASTGTCRSPASGPHEGVVIELARMSRHAIPDGPDLTGDEPDRPCRRGRRRSSWPARS